MWRSWCCLLSLLHSAATSALLLLIHSLARLFPAFHTDPAATRYSPSSRAHLYEGHVAHVRSSPAKHSFQYDVRYALVDLDDPPEWFHPRPDEYLTSSQARRTAGLSDTGKVYLLTLPSSARYSQNPISVYYCYSPEASADDSNAGFLPRGDTLQRCVAEVTNTPWGERVAFPFTPEGCSVPKMLHVSPFMDMESTWWMLAPAPGDELCVKVSAKHPEHGDFFTATLQAKRIPHIEKSVSQWFWMRSHKVAIWIYWQAVILLFKGVPFLSHPKDHEGRDNVKERNAALQRWHQAKGTSNSRNCTSCTSEQFTATQMPAASHYDFGGEVLDPRTACASTGWCIWKDADAYPWR